MFSKPPTRPPLITPSASPPPQTSSSRNGLPSPSKRQRVSSRSSSVRRSVSAAESTLDFPKEREASMARMLDTWSQLAERYSRRLDEDDIVDIRTGEIVKDNGFWKATRRFNFGEALQREDAEDSAVDDSEDDEGIDELDAFDEERNLIEDGFAKDLQQKLLTHADHGVTNDLDEFLEAEQRRKDEYGSDVEEDELDFPLKPRPGGRSPLSPIPYSNGEEGSSDNDDQDAPSSFARSGERDLDDEYDDDDDELDNWDPIEGSMIMPVRDLTSSPQGDGSEHDEQVIEIPPPTSSKRRTSPVQIHTPPPSHSLPNRSDLNPVLSSHVSPVDNTLGSSYDTDGKSILPRPSPSKFRPTRTQSTRPQPQAPEIIEISDDESSEPPSEPTKSLSPSLSPSPAPLPVPNRRQSVVPQVVITTLPPRLTHNGAATTPTKSSTTSTKQTRKPAAPKTSVKPSQSAKSTKKAAIPGTPSKPSHSVKVPDKASAPGTPSNSAIMAQYLKKTTPSTVPVKPPSVRKSAQKPREANVRNKKKLTTPQTAAPDSHSDDDQDTPESTAPDFQVGPEAGDHSAVTSSPASSQMESQVSKPSPAKRKGRKRKRSSSAFEVAELTKVQEDLSPSPPRVTSKGRTRASSVTPRRSSRRSSSRSRYSSDDDKHSRSTEYMNHKRRPSRDPFVPPIPRMQPPYTPHTPSHQSATCPPIADARAQQIITQAMHQLAALLWTPTHPVSANPMHPYPTPHHIYPSVGPNFIHSTPNHPHPYPFIFNPSLSNASLPPSSPEPPSSPIRPRERRKSLVSRGHSRGRRVSFHASEKDDESSENDKLEFEYHKHKAVRNSPSTSERSSSPPRSKRKDKGKGKEKVDIRHFVSSGSDREDDERISEKARAKNTRAASASAQKPKAGRPTKDRSSSPDPRSPKKYSKIRKNTGVSSDRL